jgi:glycosyltransferase involved in cell wall biosynthesis
MGGIETHCKELLPRIKTLNQNYHIVVLGRSPYLKRNNFFYCGVQVKGLFTIKNKYLETIVHTFFSILYARFVLKASVLHIHGIGPALMAPIASFLGMKVVVTHHGDDYSRKKWNSIAKFFLRKGEIFSIRYSEALIVVSEHVTRRLVSNHKSAESRIFYIPNGATTLERRTTEQPGEELLPSLSLKPKGYVLAVGRLVPEKSFDVLIDAFLVSAQDYDLVIAGAADHNDAYAMSLLKRAGGRVKFIGFQSHANLAALYHGAALFVLPSSHEGLPIAALEAAAAGCPMILSDIPANIEIGLSPDNYFPVGRVDLLVEKLQMPFGTYQFDPEVVTAKFDWASIAISTSNLYNRFAKIP